MTQAMDKLAVPLAPLLGRVELEPALEAMLANAGLASAAVTLLAEAGRLAEAARVVAHAMPKREAVWWACMCARAVPDAVLSDHDQAALTAAEAWVRRPDDANRRASMAAANRTGFRSPEAWAAVGAFWSGGSMAPADQPDVPPADNLTGVAIAGAVLLAAMRGAPAKAPVRFVKFLASAREIAAGNPGRLPPE